MTPATAWLSSSGDRETDLSDSSGFSSGAGRRGYWHRWADDDQVAFRVLEPRELRAPHARDAIDGLESGRVVLLELDTLGLEVLDGSLDILDLDPHLGVRPRRLAAAGEHPKTGARRHRIHDPARILLGWGQPQLVPIEGLRPCHILRGKRRRHT